MLADESQGTALKWLLELAAVGLDRFGDDAELWLNIARCQQTLILVTLTPSCTHILTRRHVLTSHN